MPADSSDIDVESVPEAHSRASPQHSSAAVAWLAERRVHVAVVVGVGWFCLALNHAVGQPIVYDANGYLELAREIVHGPRGSTVDPYVLEWLFDVRLMGYPLFLTPFVMLGLEGRSLRVSVAVAQFAFYVGSIGLLRRAIAISLQKAVADRVAIALLVIPFPYFLSVELLTDSLVISLSITCVAAVLMLASDLPPAASILWLTIALVASAATMFIRVDSFYVVGACWVGLSMIEYRRRSERANVGGSSNLGRSIHVWAIVRATSLTGILVAATVILFRVPQYFIVRSYSGRGRLSPVSLASADADLGVSVLKLATGIRGLAGQIVYRNPLLPPHALAQLGTQPVHWYARNPIRAGAMVPLRWFALVDQDMPFVYNTTVPQRPSLPLFVINHAVVIIGSVGLVSIWLRFARRDAPWRARMVTLSFSFGAVVWLATHSLPHVEARYGVPALAALSACAGYYLNPDRIRHSWRGTLALVVLYLPLAWWISTWIAGFRTLPG